MSWALRTVCPVTEVLPGGLLLKSCLEDSVFDGPCSFAFAFIAFGYQYMQLALKQT